MVEAGKSRGKPGRLLPLPEGVEPYRDEADAAPLPVLAPHRLPDAAVRHARQLHELDRHNQQLLVESPYVRATFMERLKTDSPEACAASQEAYRDYFAEKVIGRFDDELRRAEPAHPRDRNRQ